MRWTGITAKRSSAVGIGIITISILAAFSNPASKIQTQGPSIDSDVEQSREVEITGIEEALNNYLYGSKEGDVERLRRAFHPTAEIEGVRDGAITSWTAPDYVGGMTPGRTRDFEPRILSVDFTGDAAQAKVECDYGTWKFVDYMQLLKVDGEWRIANKVYHRVVD